MEFRRMRYHRSEYQPRYRGKIADACCVHSATKLQNGHDVLLSVDLVNVKQFITCYVMCDEIGEPLAIDWPPEPH